MLHVNDISVKLQETNNKNMDDFYLLLYTILHFQISFNMYSFVCLVIQQIFLMYQLSVSCVVDSTRRSKSHLLFSMSSSDWTEIIKKNKKMKKKLSKIR